MSRTKPAAGKAGIARLLTIEHPCPGLPEPEREPGRWTSIRAMPFVIRFLIIALLLSRYSLLAEETTQFFRAETVQLISTAEKVVAWRTAGSVNSSIDPSEYYKKVGDSVTVATNLVSELRKYLLDPKSFDKRPDGIVKACILRPGLVVSFLDGSRTVELYVCFECDVLLAEGRDEEGRLVKVGGGDFDSTRAKLLQIVKQIFPKDDQIQSLK